MIRKIFFLLALTFSMAVHSQTTVGDGAEVTLTIVDGGQHTPIKKAPSIRMPRLFLTDSSIVIQCSQEAQQGTSVQIYNDMGQLIHEEFTFSPNNWIIPLTEEVWQNMSYIYLTIGNRVFYGEI